MVDDMDRAIISEEIEVSKDFLTSAIGIFSVALGLFTRRNSKIFNIPRFILVVPITHASADDEALHNDPSVSRLLASSGRMDPSPCWLVFSEEVSASA